MPNDKEMGNPAASVSQASTTQKAADPVNRIVEGASQFAEDARKTGERYIEEGRRRLRGRSDAPPFGRRPPVNEAQRHGMQQDPRERVEISQSP